MVNIFESADSDNLSTTIVRRYPRLSRSHMLMYGLVGLYIWRNGRTVGKHKQEPEVVLWTILGSFTSMLGNREDRRTGIVLRRTTVPAIVAATVGDNGGVCRASEIRSAGDVAVGVVDGNIWQNWVCCPMVSSGTLSY